MALFLSGNKYQGDSFFIVAVDVTRKLSLTNLLGTN